MADVRAAKRKIKEVTGEAIEEKIIRIAAHPITYEKSDNSTGIAIGLEVSSPDLLLKIVEPDKGDGFSEALRTAACAAKIVEAQELGANDAGLRMCCDAMVKFFANDIITAEYEKLVGIN